MQSTKLSVEPVAIPAAQLDTRATRGRLRRRKVGDTQFLGQPAGLRLVGAKPFGNPRQRTLELTALLTQDTVFFWTSR